jgi:RNA exonuclease 4
MLYSMAIDCEMVGTGPNGSQSVLARVSLVNYHGHILVDSFVKPKERVTDWRTWVSGVRASDMIDAKSFEVVQKEVAEIVEGKILIGHAVENDTRVRHLGTRHERTLTRSAGLASFASVAVAERYSNVQDIARDR